MIKVSDKCVFILLFVFILLDEQTRKLKMSYIRNLSGNLSSSFLWRTFVARKSLPLIFLELVTLERQMTDRHKRILGSRIDSVYSYSRIHNESQSIPIDL